MEEFLFFVFRTKRRADKQYHSDDGYTSDPGILREVRHRASVQWKYFEFSFSSRKMMMRQIMTQRRCVCLTKLHFITTYLHHICTHLQNRRRIQELERKAEKFRRALEEDDMSLHENDEEVESNFDKPQQSHRLAHYGQYSISACVSTPYFAQFYLQPQNQGISVSKTLFAGSLIWGSSHTAILLM